MTRTNLDLLIMSVIAIVLGATVIGFALGVVRMEKKAVQHGAAHYDDKTGDFTWNTQPEKGAEK